MFPLDKMIYQLLGAIVTKKRFQIKKNYQNSLGSLYDEIEIETK